MTAKAEGLILIQKGIPLLQTRALMWLKGTESEQQHILCAINFIITLQDTLCITIRLGNMPQFLFVVFDVPRITHPKTPLTYQESFPETQTQNWIKVPTSTEEHGSFDNHSKNIQLFLFRSLSFYGFDEACEDDPTTSLINYNKGYF